MSEITDDARNPCIQVIDPWHSVFYGKVALVVGSRPKLIALNIKIIVVL